jgi:excisionase family DNA binding protein
MHNEAAILVSVPEFAARTSLSARHVWRLICEHKIPSHRVGRRRLIPLRPALDALLANQTDEIAGKIR